jgi:hypothetical protein
VVHHLLVETTQASSKFDPQFRREIVSFLDRSDLVHHTTDTVLHNLTAGMILVRVVLFAFLGNVRGAFVMAVTISFSSRSHNSLRLRIQFQQKSLLQRSARQETSTAITDRCCGVRP